ncbi:EAL domain-containing protein [uncultured Aquimonas sp.]|uniref:sensor domain-containing protein n=1 Tax=uncultured Aquimonas sp. TaxID=385483 RepID=UPI00086B3976|nr:EAL domain-containing protein [uncultured Aquimonas sp.]ODU48331.1 MAG: hypothetical protein ABS96_00395 [Xanthomonadaceae bacterium SCN 69-123]
MRPAQQRRRIARTWASAGVILLAMLLLAGSQQHAQRAHAELLVRQDQIATIRQATLLAQLHAERHAAGDSGSGLDLVRASLQRAQQTAADIGRGQGALRGLWRDTPPDPDTAASVERLLDSLRALDTLLADRDAASAPQVRLAMRGEQRRLEAALAQLEADALDAMDASRSGLARLTAALILMLAGIGVAFALWQQRAARQTDIEAAAREAREAELDAFAGSVPDISFLLDAEGRFLRVHASRPELLMVPPEQALGRLIKDLFPTEQTAAFMGLIADTLAQGKGRAEYRLLIGGSERIFEARTTAVSGADRVVWVSWDVTERVRHSERIAQLGRLYGMLSACNQALVFSKDEASLFERVTAAAVRSGGYRLAWIASAPPSRRLVASGLDAGARLPEILLEDADSPLFELLAHEPPALRVHSRRVSPRPGLAWAEACASAGLSGLSLVCLGEHEGQRLVLVLHSDTPFDLEDEQQALLAEVAGDIEYALQLMRQRRQRERMQAHLEQQALALRSSRDGILLLDARGRILSANPAACEFLGSDEERLREQPASLLADLERDPDYARAMREALRQDGHWQGEVLARHGSGQLHTLLLSLARVDGGEAEQASRVLLFTDITRQRETDARLSRIAHFDALTGLPNRDLLLIRLQAALDAHRQARQLGAAIMLDLDNFRAVNENAGWGHGDELLREVALRLGALMRPGDTLARLGGDEFVLVLERLTGVDEAERFVQAVQACLRPPIKLGQDERAYTQASLGLIRFEDAEGEAELLLRKLEVALFEAKRGGGNTWRRFAPAMGEQARQRMQLEQRLRLALQEQQFSLVYQPLVEVASGRMVGLEALVRLNQPGLPPVGPDQFIPILEQTGLINQLGDWVTLEACLQARRWLDRGWDFGSVAVNLSPSEVGRYPVEARVRRALEHSGLPPERLELEITESGLMEQGERAEVFLRELHGLGVKLAIDDFGTGYSSLASLKRFPVHKLKIDRSFITDIETDTSDAFLVEAVIDLGRKLRIQVLAEGVETERQRDFLRARGCALAQGYLFSKPLPPDALFERYGKHSP